MVSRFRLRTRSERAFAGASLLLVLCLVGAPASSMAQDGTDYVVVVSPDVPVDDLSREELRRIYRFTKRHWGGTLSITILFSEEQLVDGAFLTDEIYRLDYPSIRRLILEKLYQGELDLAPKVVSSDRVAVDFVASGSGLISVVRADAVGSADVKVLSIGGRTPASAEYPLRR